MRIRSYLRERWASYYSPPVIVNVYRLGCRRSEGHFHNWSEEATRSTGAFSGCISNHATAPACSAIAMTNAATAVHLLAGRYTVIAFSLWNNDTHSHAADSGKNVSRFRAALLGKRVAALTGLSGQNVRLLRADSQSSSPSFGVIRRGRSTRTHRRRDTRAFLLRSGPAQKSFLRRCLLQTGKQE
jgi:hypothetical protein